MFLIKWAVVRAFIRKMLANPRSTCHPSWRPKDPLEKGHLHFSFRHLDHHWSKPPCRCQQLRTAVGEGQGLTELPAYAMRQASWRGVSEDPFQAPECLFSITSKSHRDYFGSGVNKNCSGKVCLGMERPKCETLQQDYACSFITADELHNI